MAVNTTMFTESSTVPQEVSSLSEVLPLEKTTAVKDILVLSDDQMALAQSIQEPLKYIFFALVVPLAITSIIVFSTKSMRSASGTYVIALNIGQLAYVVLNIVDDIWNKFEEPFSSRAYCDYLLYVAVNLGIFMCWRGSYVILCLALIERLYAVVRPLHIKSFFLFNRPVTCVVTSYVMTVFLHLTYTANRQVSMVIYPGTVKPRCGIFSTQFYKRHEQLFYAINMAEKTLFTDVLMLLQLILNALIALSLRRHNMATKNMTPSVDEDAKRRQERQLTIILLGAAASHVIFNLPSIIFNVVHTLSPDFSPFGKYTHLYTVILNMVFSMNTLGSGVDFFCYFALSSKFRRTVYRLLGFDKPAGRPNTVTGDKETRDEEVSVSASGNT